MKNVESNDLGTKGTLSDDSLAQAVGGISGWGYLIRCTECSWERHFPDYEAVHQAGETHMEETGHEVGMVNI